MDLNPPLTVARYRMPTLAPHDQAHHAEHIVSFLLSGELSMEQGDTLSMGAGTAIVIPAGAPHRLLTGRDLELWHLSFCPHCLGWTREDPQMAPFRAVKLGAFPAVTIPVERRPILSAYFEEIDRLGQTVSTSNLDRQSSLLSLIMAELSDVMRPSHRMGEGLVERVLDYVQQHCCEPLSLSDVAAVVHRSPAYVTDRVKKATGASVGEWIIANRLQQASLRLLHTRMPVADIAEQVGWQDVTHFIRQFKKHYGSTPGQWRKAQRAGHNHESAERTTG
ncbi:helix-turn-helix domain-containing protein [Saccharospirillum salsuginis]|uniref:HTH araC/xylS-type domain-containing protein n=1 Tax=Saccharospirillum salsuginis TaxID=418750 RepID=A0A918K082_9GAMM|nr:AraC family transcriptional regulator [Saccharospirillum salsuginis]GGX40347.1 hypothetical protein GCM10007392_03810 [Saccharospirillum salsuginis]